MLVMRLVAGEAPGRAGHRVEGGATVRRPAGREVWCGWPEWEAVSLTAGAGVMFGCSTLARSTSSFRVGLRLVEVECRVDEPCGFGYARVGRRTVHPHRQSSIVVDGSDAPGRVSARADLWRIGEMRCRVASDGVRGRVPWGGPRWFGLRVVNRR